VGLPGQRLPAQFSRAGPSASAGADKHGDGVVDLGLVPTPLLYFSLHHLKVDGGVQVTGSHNPPEYNGFKICHGKATLYGEEIQELRKIAESGAFAEGRGALEQVEILEPYVEDVTAGSTAGPSRERSLSMRGTGWAAGRPSALHEDGGSGGSALLRTGRAFPNHHPDPTIPENLEHLFEKMAETGADLGIAFDGDADRIGVGARRENHLGRSVDDPFFP
jgi:phosphomannomutase / phosphoglucomutase